MIPNRFEITLGSLANKYGVPLEGSYKGHENDIIELYRTDDGKWHVSDPDLTDEEWAPLDDKQAEWIYTIRKVACFRSRFK